MTPEERFWTKVAKAGPDDCWEWTAGRSSTGYGVVRWNGRLTGAHRVAYELGTGSPLNDAYACHSCDNRGCCNPAHIWSGSHRDNVVDANRKGRAFVPTSVYADATHCVHGHPFDEANTYVHPRTGHRTCRTCRREGLRRYRLRARAAT